MFVKLWMSKQVITISEKQMIIDVVNLFQDHKIRRLPVVNDEGKLAGIVSQQDILNVSPSFLDGSATGSSTAILKTTTVRDIMTADPVAVGPLTPLEFVAQKMRSLKIGGVPVVENGEVVGIITESDIFAAFSEVLGANHSGVRIEMILGKSPQELYRVLDVFKKHDIFLQAITVHHNFGENQRLITIKVSGEDTDDMLDEIRGLRIQINRITEDN